MSDFTECKGIDHYSVVPSRPDPNNMYRYKVSNGPYVYGSLRVYINTHRVPKELIDQSLNSIGEFYFINTIPLSELPAGKNDSIYCDFEKSLIVISESYDTGIQGESGFSGFSGFSGNPGVIGVPGAQGESGYSGYSGYSGAKASDENSTIYEEQCSQLPSVPDGAIPIYDIAGLQAIQSDLTAYYYLANDIDASETVSWNEGEGFVPIGMGGNPFIGSFDGRGLSITNLTIARDRGWSSDTYNIGLFSDLGASGVIKNVNMIGGLVTGSEAIGAIAGYSIGTIINCTSNMTVMGDSYVGGIVGSNFGLVETCEFNGHVEYFYE